MHAIALDRLWGRSAKALTLVSILGMGLGACVTTDAAGESSPATYKRTPTIVKRATVSAPVAGAEPVVAPVSRPAAAPEPAPTMRVATEEVPVSKGISAGRNAMPVMVQVDGIPQDFAFDPQGGFVYVQSLRKSAGQETGFISRLRLDGLTASIVDSNLPSQSVGHQGVSVEHRSGSKVWVWVSRYGDNGRDAVRFPYQAGVEPRQVETFTFFGPGYMQKNVTMPKVCADGKHLLVRGRISSREQIVRIFSLATLNAGGPGDYSAKAVYEWPLPAEMLAGGLPLQGIACDGNYVYAVVGNARMDEEKMFVKLTLDGKPVQRVADFSVSRQAASLDGKQFEPEGISVLPVSGGKGGTVHVGVLSGNSRNLKFRLWPFDNAR